MRIEASTIVGDPQLESAVAIGQRDGGAAGAGMFEDVCERLGHEEIGSTFDVVAESSFPQSLGCLDRDLQGQPRTPVLDRLNDPPVAEHRRVDPLSKLSQLRQNLLRLEAQIVNHVRTQFSINGGRSGHA